MPEASLPIRSFSGILAEYFLVLHLVVIACNASILYPSSFMYLNRHIIRFPSGIVVRPYRITGDSFGPSSEFHVSFRFIIAITALSAAAIKVST